MRCVFKCLRRADLTLKLAKCRFGLNQVEYLGYVVGDGRILPNPKKIEAVLHYKQPVMKTDVKAFLGLAGYYRKFVPQYASISAPLTELLKKGKPELVQWTSRCKETFQTLKCKLSESPVLKVPDFSKFFVVQTDLSGGNRSCPLSNR